MNRRALNIYCPQTLIRKRPGIVVLDAHEQCITGPPRFLHGRASLDASQRALPDIQELQSPLCKEGVGVVKKGG